ncbi:MAG: trigger factor [Synergistaceae bacterium]|nr:trigger factor [Synergistota bacterium]NLM71625.1 trigger factor [Synergistaceae bacterium]
MRSEIVSQEGNIVSIKLIFEADEFVKEVDKAVKTLSSEVNIAGFRKGHVPRKVLELRLGKNEIYTEALDGMLSEAIRQTVNDYDLDLIDEPQVKIGDLEEGSPVEVDVVFEVVPEVVLPEISEITVKRPPATTDEEMVSNTIEELRMQNAVALPLEEGAVDEENVVEIEYVTTVLKDDGPAEPHGPESATLDLTQPSVRREIKEALLGAETGDTRTTEIRVEDDYPDPVVAGHIVRYEMKVKQIGAKVLPEMKPLFFEKMLGGECETEDEFREGIKKRILERVSAELNAKAELDALQSVSDLSTVNVPETLVLRQITAMIKDDVENLRQSRDISLEVMLEESGISMEDYEKKIREQAEVIVKRSLVLDKIAEERGVSVEKEDFEAEMQTLASSYNIDAKRLVEGLYRDEKRLMELANRIKYKKTIKEIMDTVRIDETVDTAETSQNEQS